MSLFSWEMTVFHSLKNEDFLNFLLEIAQKGRLKSSKNSIFLLIIYSRNLSMCNLTKSFCVFSCKKHIVIENEK